MFTRTIFISHESLGRAKKNFVRHIELSNENQILLYYVIVKDTLHNVHYKN